MRNKSADSEKFTCPHDPRSRGQKNGGCNFDRFVFKDATSSLLNLYKGALTKILFHNSLILRLILLRNLAPPHF